MKKNYLSLLLLFVLAFKSYSQCSINPNDDICRGVFAGLLFDVLYEEDYVFNYLPAFYPSPYLDLQEFDELNAKMKVLSYLQYDNGLAVFDYFDNPLPYFQLRDELSRIEATIYILEAYNIEPEYSGNSPFDDIDEDDPIFGYANKAYEEGFIDIHNGDFDPCDNMTVQETLEFLSEIINSSYHPINEDLTDEDNYFKPGIYDPFNISQSRGINQGVFSHYAKDSFVIPDVKFNLNFSHFYTTTMVELPKGFFKLKPLGSGWSHTYNAYIIRENNIDINDDPTDFYFIVWPDGTVHIFNEDEEEYVSKGVYDEFDEFNGGDEIRIRKKDQADYRFEQLDSNEDILYLIYIEDPNGNRISIEYEDSEVDNDLRRIEYVEAPSGKRLYFHYINNTDYLSSITDPIGREIAFDIDEDNDERLEKFTDAKGNETRYRYVENNQNAPLADQKKRFLLDEIELPRGNKITAEYDADDAKLENYQINNQPPVSIYLNFDFIDQQQFATVSKPVDNNSHFTEDYEFNLDGLITDYNSDTDDLEITYPSSGVNVMLPTDTNLNGVQVEYEYDDNGNVTEINKENGDVVEEFNYDSDNNLTRYTNPNGYDTVFDYDNNENLTEILDPLGNTITFTYDSHGQLLSQTNQEGITTTLTYENDGAVSSISRPEGISTTFGYDGINRLLTKESNGLVSSYTYDPNDNVTSFINSGGFPTTYDYDANDNMSSITNAHNVPTSFTYDNEDRVISEQFGNLIKEYDYSDEGFLERYTKPSGTQINYEYDNDGRLEETGTITDIDYNNKNLVESIANADSRYNFEYDNLNRLIEVEDEFNNNATTEYEYDAAGNVTKIIYPDLGADFEVRYSYDEKNRLVRVRGVLNNNTMDIVEYFYRDDDLLDEILYGNGLRTFFEYDNAGRLIHNRLYDEDTDINFFEQSLILDERNNITNQQIRYFIPEPPIYGQPDPVSQTYQYDENNHILGDFYVNEDGNLISDPIFSFSYDIDDRMVQRSDTENHFDYKYDPYGYRLSKLQNDTEVEDRYIWDIIGKNILVDANGNLSNGSFYIYGLGLEARVHLSGGILFYHGDHRGNVVMMVGEDEEIYRRYRYTDFGKTIDVTPGHNPDHNLFMFMGKYGVVAEDKDNGYYYVRARYYDSNTGRFLTEDPIWSTNLYPYAGNNPINTIDPTGKIPLPLLYIAYQLRPDVITIGGEIEGFSGPGASNSFELNFITRGENASIIPFATITPGVGIGYSASTNLFIDGRYYLGQGDVSKNHIISSNGSFDYNASAGFSYLGDLGIRATVSNDLEVVGGGFSFGLGALPGFNFSGNITRTYGFK